MYKVRFGQVYREETKDGETGEGNPTDDKKEDPKLELLTRSVGLLAQGLTELQSSNQKITETLTAIQAGAKPSEPKTKTIEEEIAERGDEFETMSNADVVKLVVERLTEKFEKRIAELSGTVEERVGSLANQFHSRVSAEEVSKVSEKNPDLMEWGPEIRKLLQEHPTLSVSRALALAREENPQKKAEMTKKYAKAPTDVKPKSFGLTPTSSRTDSGTGKMSPAEAANKAFDEIMASIVVEDEKLGT